MKPLTVKQRVYLLALAYFHRPVSTLAVSLLVHSRYLDREEGDRIQAAKKELRSIGQNLSRLSNRGLVAKAYPKGRVRWLIMPEGRTLALDMARQASVEMDRHNEVTCTYFDYEDKYNQACEDGTVTEAMSVECDRLFDLWQNDAEVVCDSKSFDFFEWNDFLVDVVLIENGLPCEARQINTEKYLEAPLKFLGLEEYLELPR